MEFLRDLWGFITSRRKFWLLPLIVVILILGAIIVFSSGSAIAPFIYSIF